MKDQDFKELAESFHAIYMDPDLRRELLQLEDGLDAEPDSAEDDEPEMHSQIFDVFAQIQDLNKKRFPCLCARAGSARSFRCASSHFVRKSS